MSTEKNQNNFKFSPWYIYILAIALFIGLSIFNGNGFQDPSVISTSKFDDLLAKGDIEKVIIYNKVQAEAFLTKKALSDKSNKDVANDFMNRPNKGPHYIFNLGDIQEFEKKLDSAKKAKKLKEFDHKQKGDWAEVFFSLLPIIIIIAVWIFIMKRMSGGGAAGGGGQIFNIGKSKAKLFDEKTDVKVTFKDVAGLEGAKEEIQDFVFNIANIGKQADIKV